MPLNSEPNALKLLAARTEGRRLSKEDERLTQSIERQLLSRKSPGGFVRDPHLYENLIQIFPKNPEPIEAINFKRRRALIHAHIEYNRFNQLVTFIFSRSECAFTLLQEAINYCVDHQSPLLARVQEYRAIPERMALIKLHADNHAESELLAFIFEDDASETRLKDAISYCEKAQLPFLNGYMKLEWDQARVKYDVAVGKLDRLFIYLFHDLYCDLEKSESLFELALQCQVELTPEAPLEGYFQLPFSHAIMHYWVDHDEKRRLQYFIFKIPSLVDAHLAEASSYCHQQNKMTFLLNYTGLPWYCALTKYLINEHEFNTLNHFIHRHQTLEKELYHEIISTSLQNNGEGILAFENLRGASFTLEVIHYCVLHNHRDELMYHVFKKPECVDYMLRKALSYSKQENNPSILEQFIGIEWKLALAMYYVDHNDQRSLTGFVLESIMELFDPVVVYCVQHEKRHFLDLLFLKVLQQLWTDDFLFKDDLLLNEKIKLSFQHLDCSPDLIMTLQSIFISMKRVAQESMRIFKGCQFSKEYDAVEQLEMKINVNIVTLILSLIKPIKAPSANSLLSAFIEKSLHEVNPLVSQLKISDPSRGRIIELGESLITLLRKIRLQHARAVAFGGEGFFDEVPCSPSVSPPPTPRREL